MVIAVLLVVAADDGDGYYYDFDYDDVSFLSFE